MGLPVWCTDQAGPFQTIPYPGRSWRPAGEPARLPHEYLRDGTAKVLTLFHPADGRVRVQGATSCPNAVLHPWLKRELATILAAMPEPDAGAKATVRRSWERWQDGLTIKPTCWRNCHRCGCCWYWTTWPGTRPPRSCAGCLNMASCRCTRRWAGSWLNMAESTQRVLKRRALDGRHPSHTGQIIAWFEAVAGHWNESPTPFVWGGKRAARRQRQRERRHRVGGSGAYTRVPIRRVSKSAYGYRQGK